MAEITLRKIAAPVYSIPASATPEGASRLTAYYEALGRFVDMFSQTETAITLTLRSYAGTPPWVANVIFSGTKIELGSTFIKQLAAANGVPSDAQQDLEYILQQLGIINGVRNQIMHFGATDIAEGNAYVTNALKAKGDPVSFPISPTALNQMTTDLLKIINHLNYRHLGRRWPKGALAISILEGVLTQPWRYNHPVPPKEQSKRVRDRPPRTRGRS